MTETEHVEPAPLPISWELGEGQFATGDHFVLAKIHTVHGTQWYFLPDDFARELGKALIAASTGLTLPPSGLVVPGR